MEADEPLTPATGEVVDPLRDTPGDWLPIEKAADRLACSQRTVWRMISRGTLRRRGVGGRAEVFIPTAMPPVGTPSADLVPATPVSPDAVTLAVIDELRAQRTEDRTRLDSLLADLGASREEIGALRATNAHLEAEVARLRRRRWWRWWR